MAGLVSSMSTNERRMNFPLNSFYFRLLGFASKEHGFKLDTLL